MLGINDIIICTTPFIFIKILVHFWANKTKEFQKLRIVGTWHGRFETLVGKYHIGVYKIIKEIHKELIVVKRKDENIVRKRAHSASRWEYDERQKRNKAIKISEKIV